jgi:hypothetical protein
MDELKMENCPPKPRRRGEELKIEELKIENAWFFHPDRCRQNDGGLDFGFIQLLKFCQLPTEEADKAVLQKKAPMRKNVFGWLLLGGMVLTGCHLDEDPIRPADIFGFWRYQSGVTVELPDAEPGIIPLAYVTLKEDGTMGGMTSRNILGGTFRYDESGLIKLDFNPLTRVYDTPWSISFQDMLNSVDRYRLEDDRLWLRNTETDEELAFIRMSAQTCIPTFNDRQLFEEAESDPFTFKDVVIAGSCLEITIEYGGGCGEAEALLIGSGQYLYSLPPQLHIRLILEDDDPCEALVRKTFYFNLNTILPASEESIILHLQDWPLDIYYTK